MSSTVEAVLRQFDNARYRLRGADLTAEEADTLETELNRLAELVNTRRRPVAPPLGRHRHGPVAYHAHDAATPGHSHNAPYLTTPASELDVIDQW